jgi:hypothetical protein
MATKVVVFIFKEFQVTWAKHHLPRTTNQKVNLGRHKPVT